MQNRCAKHLFEGAEDRCGKCGLEFCGECLVYAFGPKKPPLCIPCAVAAAGIRAAAGNRPALGKSEMKRMQKERMSAFKRFRRERSTPAPAPAVVEPATPVLPEPAVEPMPSPVIEPGPVTRPPAERRPAPAFHDEPFVTEPAYVDPTPSTMPVPGI